MSKEEEIFADYCNRMMRLAIPLFERERQKYGTEEFEMGQGIDFFGCASPGWRGVA